MSYIKESGRSMVEILGVLAVIGVLSIGGIYGYRLAMAKQLIGFLMMITGWENGKKQRDGIPVFVQPVRWQN